MRQRNSKQLGRNGPSFQTIPAQALGFSGAVPRAVTDFFILFFFSGSCPRCLFGLCENICELQLEFYCWKSAAFICFLWSWRDLLLLRRAQLTPAPSVPLLSASGSQFTSCSAWPAAILDFRNLYFPVQTHLQMLGCVKEILQLFLSLALSHQQAMEWFSSRDLEFQ